MFSQIEKIKIRGAETRFLGNLERSGKHGLTQPKVSDVLNDD